MIIMKLLNMLELIKTVSDTVFDMINAAYYVKPLILIRAIFKFIKAVSDTVFDMINAVYHDKPLILIRAMFKFIKAVSDTVFDTINAVYHDKPLILIRAIINLTIDAEITRYLMLLLIYYLTLCASNG